MFDLFRKEEISSLKEKIVRLEEDNRKLLLQLEKRDERTKKTIFTKQEVDRELNEATQKISTLLNEIQKLREETKSELNFRFAENLSKSRLEEIISMLGSAESKTSLLVTIYLAKDEGVQNLGTDLAGHIDSLSLNLIDKISSTTGKVVFYYDQIIRLVLIPVFPIVQSEYSLDRHFRIEPFRNSLQVEKTFVLNAHAGETFIGIVEADSIIEHDIVRSSVMGKHSKGGWSQKRFQSLVDEDVRHHTDKVRTSLATILEKHKDVQYVIAGGEMKLIKKILEGYDIPLITKSMDARMLNPQQLLKEMMAVRMYGI